MQDRLRAGDHLRGWHDDGTRRVNEGCPGCGGGAVDPAYAEAMPAEPTPFTRPLADAGGIAEAGGKGANLGVLLRAGFGVPDGFVVTTDAYERSGGGQDLAPEVADAVVAAYAALGGGPVAVRSSATAEDLPGASFAGQHETFLNVVGPDAVVAAVRRCWASLWTERAVSYRAGRDAASEPRLSIAVVVQRLVPADVAGVLFTADPTTGRRDETVITAAWGLGESVVGGTVDVDTRSTSTRTASAATRSWRRASETRPS